MIIYKIINKINLKSYIGLTTKTVEQRWAKHVRDSLGSARRSQALHLAIRKYGKENFYVEILAKCRSIEELNLKEFELIKEHGTMSPNGYNLHTGGNYHTISSETKVKMALAQMGKKQSEETKEKRNSKLKGRVWEQDILDKRAKSISKSVLEINSGQIFSSVNEAAEYFKVNPKGISKNLHGKSNHYFGLKFRFMEIK